MMDPQMLERHFAKIGARAKLRTDPRRSREASMAIDVRADRVGEYFDLLVGPRSTAELAVIDTHPQLRHLVLMSRDDDGKHKFLCGHDERHWFVAAVPESRAVSTVATAIEALEPDGVRWRERRLPLKPRNRYRRRNAAFVRQGEWFFVPMGPRFQVNAGLILQNEPLRRAGGKPHMVEELTRDGGEAVYVCAEYPNGLTPRQYQVLLSRKPTLRGLGWIVQRRNPQVFVRGKVRHADHKTIVLQGWHQVLMNTENQSAAMRHVAFID